MLGMMGAMTGMMGGGGDWITVGMVLLVLMAGIALVMIDMRRPR